MAFEQVLSLPTSTGGIKLSRQPQRNKTMELIVLDAKGKVGTAVAALPQVNVTVVTDVDALSAQLKSCTVQPSTLLFVNQ